MKSELLFTISGYRGLCFYKGQLLVSKRNKLFFYNLETKKKEYCCEIKLPFIFKLLIQCRLIARVLRLECSSSCVLDIEDRILVAFGKEILQINPGKKEIEKRKKLSYGSRPLSIAKVSYGSKEYAVFGDYGYLRGLPAGIHIWGPGGEWQFRQLFKSGEIDHIHGVFFQREKERLWALSGDSDASSGIWRLAKDWSSLEAIRIGEQKYRTCKVFFNGDEIIYATDSQFEKNSIRLMNTKSGKEKDLARLPGSCISSTKVGESYFFATAVEPGSRFKCTLLNLLDKKPGPGILDNSSVIIGGSPDEGFFEVIKIKKDFLPMGLFQFGGFSFVEVPEDSKYLIAYCIGLVGHDDNTLVFRIN